MSLCYCSVAKRMKKRVGVRRKKIGKIMWIHFHFTQKASDCGLLSEKTDYESLQQQFAHEQQWEREGAKKSKSV